jgi:hypothetical protein
MTNKTKDELIDLSLLGLLDSTDEDAQEFALDDLIERHKTRAFDLVQIKKPYRYDLRSSVLLALAQVIHHFKPGHAKSLHIYIERELPIKLSFLFSKLNGLDQLSPFEILQDEITFIKRIQKDFSDFDIANLLQIPFERGQDLLAQGNKHGFTPLLRQINNVQWLVLYNINQDNIEASYSHLNHHLGLNIGHLKKVEWWAKYEIFEIIKK